MAHAVAGILPSFETNKNNPNKNIVIYRVTQAELPVEITTKQNF